MHAGELAQLAVVFASSTGELVRRPRPLAADGIRRYWVASQCRLDRWAATLHQLTSPSQCGERTAQPSSALLSVLEEVLVSDLLTRGWTAVSIAHDRARKDGGDAEPVARSILEGHEDARQRTLHLILDGAFLTAKQAVALNRLRRRAERWTDVVIGHLMAENPHPAIGQVAFDAEATAQTATRLAPLRDETQRDETWDTLRRSLSSAFGRPLAAPAEGELNTEIAASVLAALGPDFAESSLLPELFWRLRLENATSDMQGMLEELLLLESPPATRQPTPPGT